MSAHTTIAVPTSANAEEFTKPATHPVGVSPSTSVFGRESTFSMPWERVRKAPPVASSPASQDASTFRAVRAGISSELTRT